MKRGTGISRALLLLGCVALLAAPPAHATSTEAFEAAYAVVLDAHTRAVDAKVGTRVDYRALAADPRWRGVVTALAQVDPRVLEGRAARLAFFVNAYNVLAIDLVAAHYPVDGIRDIGSFFSPVWKRDAGKIGGRAHSLDEIEHEVLRPMGDPRIHVAIVCASVSCPSLRREPFAAAHIDAQLDSAARAFLAQREKGMRIDRAEGTLWLSRIFKWFEGDFDGVKADAPGAPGGVVAFVSRYVAPEDRAWLSANHATLDIEYFDYDWSLND